MAGEIVSSDSVDPIDFLQEGADWDGSEPLENQAFKTETMRYRLAYDDRGRARITRHGEFVFSCHVPDVD